MSDYLVKPLEYFFEDGSHVIFEKYTIDTLGIIRNKKSGKTKKYRQDEYGYNTVVIYDAKGKQRSIRVARAVASTFLGSPPTSTHTADHIISEEKSDDALSNIRWNDLPGQRANQKRIDTKKSAFIIVKNGIEKTTKEWVKYLENERSSRDKKYTKEMITGYAIRKQHGFAYKEYSDLPGEIWKTVPSSKNGKESYWDVSDQNRVKYITQHATNVFSNNRLRKNSDGYPQVSVNKKNIGCHVLVFMTFYPDIWAAKKPDEIVLHEDDDKEDFRPHKLRLGTQSENTKDSYDNGKRDGTKSARMKCASYVEGVFEKEHESQMSAGEYLKHKECSKSSIENIGSAISSALTAFRNGKIITRYGRTWRTVN
jgi:hypothetical protein